MGDWIGLGFFVVLIVGIAIGLKVLSKPQKRTPEEFERKGGRGHDDARCNDECPK